MDQNLQIAAGIVSKALAWCNTASQQTVTASGKANQLLWKTVGLPADTLLLDRIHHHQTTSDQTLEECAWTGLFYFVLTFLSVILVDFMVTRPVTWLVLKATGKSTKGFTKTSWMLLHATFNTFIMIVSWKEMWECFFDPVGMGFTPKGWWGSHPGSMLGVIAIGAFHMHHFVFFEFTFEDIVHHLLNAGIVVVIGVLAPWGRLTALSNMAMCAVPGGLNYFALWMRKSELISTQNQKQLNRFCNIVLRYPNQLAAAYCYILNVKAGNVPPCHWFTTVMMVFGLVAHTGNSLYYCDQVVGNYWIYQERKKDAKKEGKTSTPVWEGETVPVKTLPVKTAAAAPSKSKKKQ